MTNRKISAPILSTVVLSLVTNFALPSKAESVAPTAAISTAIPTGASSTVPAVSQPISYTVVAGDTLTSIANKFNTTRRKLRKLNNLASSVTKVKPGQTLSVPAPQTPKSATASATAKKKTHHAYVTAQPVQDFDVPASTFASCPVPLPSPEDDVPAAEPAVAEKPAPVAKLVSPAEMAAEAPSLHLAPPAPSPRVEETPVSPAPSGYKFSANRTPAPSVPSPMPAFHPPTPHLTSRSFNQNATPRLSANSSPMLSASADDWGNKFLQQARELGNQGIEYDDDWRPPGEARSWTMDCSNTTRYLYKVTAGLQLPRTASDQYYYLHLQGKAWDVPLIAEGLPDTDYLRRHLKPGDLLFWENTYRPERQPPITHVMVFLGTNARGEWIMAGSQSSRGGEHNRRNGGPDVYVFRPSQPCGGYSTWMGLVHHKGRFCAFGRPLEADPSKLSVAESN
jgi:cell wall-associated NlpC family hydrolase